LAVVRTGAAAFFTGAAVPGAFVIGAGLAAVAVDVADAWRGDRFATGALRAATFRVAFFAGAALRATLFAAFAGARAFFAATARRLAFAAVFLRAGDVLAPAFFATVFDAALRATFFVAAFFVALRAAFFAATFLTGVFFAAAFFAAVFFAVDFFAVAFFDAPFFTAFLVAAFFATDFFDATRFISIPHRSWIGPPQAGDTGVTLAEPRFTAPNHAGATGVHPKCKSRATQRALHAAVTAVAGSSRVECGSSAYEAVSTR
jgi:hypothetical protein